MHVINIRVEYRGKGMSAQHVLHFTEVCTPIATIAFIYWFRLVVGTFEPHFHCLMVSYVVDLRKGLVLFSQNCAPPVEHKEYSTMAAKCLTALHTKTKTATPTSPFPTNMVRFGAWMVFGEILSLFFSFILLGKVSH